ncbi:LamG domain-containing protein, partial [Novosphingobium sp.]|uniref:LamG domain-containing protein n=1 Tax=Novosphingobium sp. TaxID=1874826 RepID=UPI00261DAAD6
MSWPNGWRQLPGATAPRIFAIEASRYDFSLDLADFSKAGFYPVEENDVGYLSALSRDPRRMLNLPAAAFRIEVDVNGKTYRAKAAKAGQATGGRPLSEAWMWESGRYVQHYEFKGLDLETDAGEKLVATSSLSVVAWPDSLTFTARLEPSDRYDQGPVPGRIGDGLCLVTAHQDLEQAAAIDPSELTLALWVKIPENLARADGWLLAKNGSEVTDGTLGFKFVQKNLQAIMNVGGRYFSIPAQPKDYVASQWIHLALAYDGKQMSYYLNGKRQGVREINLPRKGPGGPLRLGRPIGSNGPMLAAIFDELKIWNRALSAREIAAAAKPEGVVPREGLVFEEDFQSGAQPKAKPALWSDAVVRLALSGEKINLQTRAVIAGAWRQSEEKTFSLTSQPKERATVTEGLAVKIKAGGAGADAVFDPTKNCFVTRVDTITRDFKTGYTDIRDYDEFVVTVQNDNADHRQVPFLLDFRSPANITGIIPILCDAEGRPTGLPMQLSKNWHYRPMGDYLMSYAYLPAAPGTTTYRIRVVYGFYGTVPVASHSQLSLVGYGGNGRWEQLAIGCWGETTCLDMDNSLVDVAVTDVRLLMARLGETARKWDWTTASWGGDWLGLQTEAGQKIPFGKIKTAYLAHGPCLTDVRYEGAYGVDDRVLFRAEAGMPRTDDYARTYQRLSYTFRQPASATDTWFYRLGSNGNLITPRLVYGNQAGLIADRKAPADLPPQGTLADQLELTGEGPWWIYLPDADNVDAATKPAGRHTTGDRALVIRSYKAVFGGRTYSTPSFTARNHRAVQDGKGPNLNIFLVAPANVAQIAPGDSVEMRVDLVTLPRAAADYYGPNEAFRQQLIASPSSWKTIHREAAGNNLAVRATGGDVLQSYPIVVRANATVVEVEITGGVGYVPIRFEGLSSRTGYSLHEITSGREIPLDQSVHGNDFWQAD